MSLIPDQSSTRRKFLSNTSIALGTVAGSSLLSGPLMWAQAAAEENVEAKTAYGRLRGKRNGDLVTFKGVPYAGSVSGENRFKAPPKLEPWTGVRDAFSPGAPSIQSSRPYYGKTEPFPAEDCLFLNIWTPAADNRRRPVMVYNHGGGFVIGSGSSFYQDGGNLARENDVVVVASNHRLGLLGYLFLADLAGEEYATSGNQGIMDIVAALKWVRENIEAFGGDPHNVMTWGESGGGAKTSCIYAMPSAKDYFNKASIESGPGVHMCPRDIATETAKMALSELGLTDKDFAKLKTVPADKLFEVQQALAKKNPMGPGLRGGRSGRQGMIISRPGGFMPVVDGTYLPHHPFDPTAPDISKDKPLIVGTNKDEMEFFLNEQKDIDAFTLTEDRLKARLNKELGENSEVIYAAYRKSRPDASPAKIYESIGTARMMWLGSIEIAEKKYEQKGAPVYMYMFVHNSNRLVPGTDYHMGTPHASEIVHKFDNVDVPPPAGSPFPPSAAEPGRKQSALNMSQMWATFARTGRPGAKGQPEWPAYDLQKRATMMIDAECKVESNPFGQELAMWDSLKA